MNTDTSAAPAAAAVRPLPTGLQGLCALVAVFSMAALMKAHASDPAELASVALVLMLSPWLSRQIGHHATTLLAMLGVTAIALLSFSDQQAMPLIMLMFAAWQGYSLGLVRTTPDATRMLAPTIVSGAFALHRDEGLLCSLLVIFSVCCALLAAAWSAQPRQGRGGFGPASWRLLVALALAIPPALAVFMLFPRVPSTFKAHAAQESKAWTGMSTSMTPGAVAELARSSRLAFYASFHVETMPSADLYWRAAVLDVFDGLTWRASTDVAKPLPRTHPTARGSTAPSYSYQVELPADAAPFVPLLDGTRPESIVAMTAGNVPFRLRSRLDGVFEMPYAPEETLRIRSIAFAHSLAYKDQPPRPSDTQLPAGGNPKARALAAHWAAEPGMTTRRLIGKFNDLVSNGPYTYTLNPPVWRDHNGIDQFLFDSRAGFCEHYAAALAFLMRAANVPARIVTGYQGAEIAGLEARVLSRNAHAWTEVWIEGAGWTRIDPTTFIHFSRIDPDARYGLQPGSGWGWRIVSWGRQLSSAWDESVVQYGEEKRQAVLTRFSRPLQFTGAVAMALVLLALAWQRLRLTSAMKGHPAPTRLTRTYARRVRQLRRQGLSLPAYPSPTQVIMALEGSALESRQTQIEWFHAYERMRYAGVRDPQQPQC